VKGEPCGAPPGRGRCSCTSTVQPSGRNALDDWGFEQLEPWLQARTQMPVGPLFCVINGRTRGRAWHPSAARAALRRRATRAGVRRRFAPHQLRHAHALDLLREGVPLNVIQRQLGHRNLGVTSIYLQGIDPDEIIQTVHAHRPPMIPASVGLALPRLR
jgi:site-specific recombinase XerD